MLRAFRNGFRSVLVFAILLGGIFSGCDSSDQDTRVLSDALANLDQPSSTKTLATLLHRLGDTGHARLRKAAIEAERDDDLCKVMDVLLAADVNRHLSFAVDVWVAHGTRCERLLPLVTGRLNCESRRILQREILQADGTRRQILPRILALVADDQRSLQIAKSLVERGVRSTDEAHAVLNLLGIAAYFNDDHTAFNVVRPLIDSPDRGVRLAAVMALIPIPGATAEGLLRDTLRTSPDAYTVEFSASTLEGRRKMHERPKPRALGWSKDTEPSECVGNAQRPTDGG